MLDFIRYFLFDTGHITLLFCWLAVYVYKKIVTRHTLYNKWLHLTALVSTVAGAVFVILPVIRTNHPWYLNIFYGMAFGLGEVGLYELYNSLKKFLRFKDREKIIDYMK